LTSGIDFNKALAVRLSGFEIFLRLYLTKFFLLEGKKDDDLFLFSIGEDDRITLCCGNGGAFNFTVLPV
jgi:hypothetical protein